MTTPVRRGVPPQKRIGTLSKNAVKKPAKKTHIAAVNKQPEDRVPTYVRGLDERLEGGIPQGFLVLVSGVAGSMKSSLTYSILYHLHKNNAGKGLYITLEQSRDSLIRHMAKLGMKLPEDDMPYIMDFGYIRSLAEGPEEESQLPWLESLHTALSRGKDMGCKAAVIDSLAALYSLLELKKPRAQLFHFFNKLKALNMTVFVITEMERDSGRFGPYGIEEFLADGIIHLDLAKEHKAVNLYLGVAKLRNTDHDRGYHPLMFKDGAFSIVTRR